MSATAAIRKSRSLPFTKAEIERLAQSHPTPFYVYDERGIRAAARGLIDAFTWAPEFTEYFAVKATPNPAILSILREEGCGADASSLPELILAQQAGITGEQIMFTSNDTPSAEFRAARELGAIINLDDASHIPFLEEHAGIPELVCLRYNPGRAVSSNAIIGQPDEAKYGVTRTQLFDGYRLLKHKGARRFGLHTMLVSNERNPASFVQTAQMLIELVSDIHRELKIRIEFMNLGGGIGIPYRPEDEPVNLAEISHGIQCLFRDHVAGTPLDPLRLSMECGRLITGPHGYLVSRVLHLKDTYRTYVGLDATMANLMRPAMYGAYHHVTILGKEDAPATHAYDVTGSLCENNDKFAIGRQLPKVAIGDLVVIHDAGAHGHAMGFTYNGKLRSAEFLLEPDRSFRMIRRAETMDDYFATLHW